MSTVVAIGAGRPAYRAERLGADVTGLRARPTLWPTANDVRWSGLVVGAVRALANPSREVGRLLELAGTWPNSLPDDLPPPASYKTARQLQPAEVDDLVTAYRAGATTRDLGVQFGVCRGTVGRHLKARGIDTRASALRPEDLQEAAKLYRDGWTLNKLANRYEVGYNTMRVHLVTAGVVMRPRGRKVAR